MGSEDWREVPHQGFICLITVSQYLSSFPSPHKLIWVCLNLSRNIRSRSMAVARDSSLPHVCSPYAVYYRYIPIPDSKSILPEHHEV